VQTLVQVINCRDVCRDGRMGSCIDVRTGDRVDVCRVVRKAVRGAVRGAVRRAVRRDDCKTIVRRLIVWAVIRPIAEPS